MPPAPDDGAPRPANAALDVKTAGRTVDLFEVFARAQAPLTLSEIARALGAPQSSCFNLIRSLEARGYLYSVGGAKRLYPTRRLYEVAAAIAEFDPVVPRIAPRLERLRDETGETVIFGTRQGDQVVYLAVVESNQTIRYISHAGALKPLHSSAIGKALLMELPAEQREKLVRRLKLAAVTANTVTDAAALLDELIASQARRYTLTKGENVADVMAVACPVMIEGVAYGIAVAGPVARVTADPATVAAQIRAALGEL